MVLTNSQGEVADEVNYSDKWHFALISYAEGVAVERIDPAGASDDAGNRHSAASTAGYRTPTYKDSQYRQTDAVNATIEVKPRIFSPVNDGHEDIATIQCQVEEPGYIANIVIFNASGKAVRYFVKTPHWP